MIFVSKEQKKVIAPSPEELLEIVTKLQKDIAQNGMLSKRPFALVSNPLFELPQIKQLFRIDNKNNHSAGADSEPSIKQEPTDSHQGKFS